MRLRIALLGLIVAGCGPAGATVADGTPKDLAEVVEATMAAIEESLPAHSACLDGLTITHAWELDNRAEYRLETATIVLRVPATAAHLEVSLAHEVAHHLDFACGLGDGTRQAFTTAQNLDPAATWEESDSWQSTPAELFATAVATHVTGRPDELRRIDISEEAMEVVARWAVGDPMPHSAGG